MLFEGFQIFHGLGLIHLIGDHHPRTLKQIFIVVFELIQKLAIVFPGFASFAACHVEQDHDQFAAADMPQKRMTQTFILVRSRDQSRYVADSNPVVIHRVTAP